MSSNTFSLLMDNSDSDSDHEDEPETRLPVSPPSKTRPSPIEERKFGRRRRESDSITTTDTDQPKVSAVDSDFLLLELGREMRVRETEKKQHLKRISGFKKKSLLNRNQSKDEPSSPTGDEDEKPHDPRSFKRVLCYNVLNRGECTYGDKCVYAHSLTEQKVDEPRKTAYKIVQGSDSLASLEIGRNRPLHQSLLQLCKLCMLCVKGICPGGHNCKYGAYCKRFQICHTDYMNGDCRTSDCPMVHLTKRGLVPYNIQKIRGKLHHHISPKRRLLQPEFDRELGLRRIEAAKPDPKVISSQRNLSPPVKGMQLSERYFSRTKGSLTEDRLSDVSMEELEIERSRDFIDDPAQTERELDTTFDDELLSEILNL